MAEENENLAISIADESIAKIDGLPKLEFIPPRKNLLADGVQGASSIRGCLNSDSKYVLTNKGATLDFKEPAFVSSVFVSGEASKIVFFAKRPNGSEFTVKGYPGADGRYYFNCSKIICGIRLEPENGLWGKKKPEIGGIEILQWGFSDFESISSALEKSISTRGDLEAIRSSVRDEVAAQRSRLAEELLAHNQERMRIEQRVVDLTEKESALELSVDELIEKEQVAASKASSASDALVAVEGRVAEAVSREESLIRSVEEKKKALSGLIDDVADAASRLRDFEKKANMFPDDLKGFAERADRTKVTYYVLSAVPLFILAFFSWRLFMSAEALVSASGMTLQDVYSHLLQRLPYVVVVTTLAGGAFGFLLHVIRRIEEVHQQEMNLSKISIVARDISNSEFGEEGEELQKQKRLDLKVQMVQNYLFAEIGRTEIQMNQESRRYQQWGLFQKIRGILGLQGTQDGGS